MGGWLVVWFKVGVDVVVTGSPWVEGVYHPPTTHSTNYNPHNTQPTAHKQQPIPNHAGLPQLCVWRHGSSKGRHQPAPTAGAGLGGGERNPGGGVYQVCAVHRSQGGGLGNWRIYQGCRGGLSNAVSGLVE